MPIDLTAAAFYVLATVLCAAAFMVVASRNPVHSVLFLILCFFTSAGLFVLLGAEFLAMLLVVVYVGAVAVLFLFVVMMLDIDFAELKKGFADYAPFGALVGAAISVQMILVALAMLDPEGSGPRPAPGGVTNVEAIASELYSTHVFAFQASGLVLLLAMVGAVVLTLRKRVGVRRQDVGAQVGRNPKTAVALVDKPSGQGL